MRQFFHWRRQGLRVTRRQELALLDKVA